MDEEFLKIQDAYLQEKTREKGVTDLADLAPHSDGLYLWQGDITALKCDAIVNAANNGMTDAISLTTIVSTTVFIHSVVYSSGFSVKR